MNNGHGVLSNERMSNRQEIVTNEQLCNPEIINQEHVLLRIKIEQPEAYIAHLRERVDYLMDQAAYNAEFIQLRGELIDQGMARNRE